MKARFVSTAAILAVATAVACGAPVFGQEDFDRDHRHPNDVHTKTPIKHLVIIFNENRSFDHYFATYPNAANPSGSIPFVAAYAEGEQPRQRQPADQQSELH